MNKVSEKFLFLSSIGILVAKRKSDDQPVKILKHIQTSRFSHYYAAQSVFMFV